MMIDMSHMTWVTYMQLLILIIIIKTVGFQDVVIFVNSSASETKIMKNRLCI